MKKVALFLGLFTVLVPCTLAWAMYKSDVQLGIEKNFFNTIINQNSKPNDLDEYPQKIEASASTKLPGKIDSKQEEINNTPVEKVIGIINEAEQDVKDRGPFIAKEDYLKGNLILINKWTSLPESYIPDNLVKAIDKNNKTLLTSTDSGVQIKEITRESAIKMFEAAQKSGVEGLTITSGYRAYDLQSYLYKRKVSFFMENYDKKIAEEKAAQIVAPPGTSEHQAGLAIDITTQEMLKLKDTLIAAFGDTKQGKWINENSWKYGFIVRYQPEKMQITGITYEPWHLRYVGAPHSEIMFKNNWCMEEYLEHLKKEKHISYMTEDGKEHDIFYTTAPVGAEVFAEVFEQPVVYDISGNGTDGFIVTITK